MITSYGWSDTLQRQFQAYAARDLAPGRVIVQQRGLYVLATSSGEVAAQLSGRFAHEADDGAYRIDNLWTIRLKSAEKPTIRDANGKQELLFPVKFTNGQGQITQHYEW